MASATLILKINKWIKAVNIIVNDYTKLESDYAKAFDSIIYYAETSAAPFDIATHVNVLYEYLDGCVQSDFTTALRDFCKLSESALADNYTDFRKELINKNFWSEIQNSKGYVPSFKKAELERIQKEREEAAKRERERIARAEAEKRRKEEEARKRIEEERKRIEEAEKKRLAEIEKRKKAIEKGRLDEENNPLKLKIFLRSLLLSLITIGISYVLFLSPISLIAKWPVLTGWQCFFYMIGALVGTVIPLVAIMVIIDDSARTPYSDTMMFMQPITLLMFWFTYGAYRIYPVLDGLFSWTVFVLFILFDIILLIISLSVMDDDDCVYYRHDGNAWSRKNRSTAISLLAAAVGIVGFVFTCLSISNFYDYAHKTVAYHKGEYRELLRKAYVCLEQDDYYTAIKYYEEARERKTNKKKIRNINRNIQYAEGKLTEQAAQLKSEIKVLLDVFKKISYKYGRPDNDLQKAQYKIDLLRRISPADPEVNKLQQQLNYHKNRTK